MHKQWLPKSGLLWQALCRGNAGGGSELGNRIKKKKREHLKWITKVWAVKKKSKRRRKRLKLDKVNRRTNGELGGWPEDNAILPGIISSGHSQGIMCTALYKEDYRRWFNRSPISGEHSKVSQGCHGNVIILITKSKGQEVNRRSNKGGRRMESVVTTNKHKQGTLRLTIVCFWCSFNRKHKQNLNAT